MDFSLSLSPSPSSLDPEVAHKSMSAINDSCPHSQDEGCTRPGAPRREIHCRVPATANVCVHVSMFAYMYVWACELVSLCVPVCKDAVTMGLLCISHLLPPLLSVPCVVSTCAWKTTCLLIIGPKACDCRFPFTSPVTFLSPFLPSYMELCFGGCNLLSSRQ